MVEEIVDRYLAAQPKPKKVRRWPWVLAGLVLCGALFSLFDRLDTLNSQYNALQNNVSHVQNSVDRQIGTITNRVEEILKSQNDLTADYGTEIARANLESNSITFSVYATPKTFVEGMSAEFSLDNGNGSTIQPVLPIGQTFKAEITCELTDTLTLSVVFIAPDGTRRTQLLDTYEGLYSETLPQVDVQDDLMYLPVTQTETPVTSSPFKPALAEVRDHTRYLWTQEVLPTGSTPGLGSAAVSSIRVGLFKNQSLVAWAESCEKPESYHGFEDCTFYQLPELQISMLDGDTLQTAAVVTDEYGRTLVCPSTPYVLNEDHTELTYPAYSEQDTDPSHWTFD